MRIDINRLFFIRRKTAEYREYPFVSGVVNVISGGHATGKSSVIEMIDYALCSDELNIDDRIAKALEWVGVVLKTIDGYHIMARNLSSGGGKSNGCYYAHYVEKLPADFHHKITKHNRNSREQKEALSRITGADLLLTIDSEGKEHIPSVRSMLDIVLQDYTTIANSETLFRHGANSFVVQNLKKWYPYAMGLIPPELMKLEMHIALEQKELKRMQVEVERANNISAKWRIGLRSQLIRAKELGLLGATEVISDKPSEMIALVKKIIEDNENLLVSIPTDSATATIDERVDELEKELEHIAVSMQDVRTRLNELQSLKRQVDELKKESEESHERLQLAEWISNAWGSRESTLIPNAGCLTIEQVKDEISALKKAMKGFEDTILNRKKVLAFGEIQQREVTALEKELRNLRKLSLDKSAELRVLANENKAIKGRISHQKEAYSLLGKLEANCELTEALTKTEFSLDALREKAKKIEQAEQQRDDLKYKTEEGRIAFHNKLVGLIKENIEILKPEQSVMDVDVRFDYDKLEILISADGSDWVPLSRRGSSTNHIAYHVAYIAAVMEMLSNCATTPLPAFAIFDQPGQSRTISIGEAEEDYDMQQKAINTLVASTINSIGGWTAIVLDQIDSSYLKTIPEDHYHLVADFDKTGGLLPMEWLQ